MALIQAWNPTTGGSGGQTLEWERDRVVETDPFSAGYAIVLTETPLDENAIMVWSKGMILDTDDYSYDSGTNSIIINFSGDPSTDTSNGEWVFSVTYPYEVV